MKGGVSRWEPITFIVLRICFMPSNATLSALARHRSPMDTSDTAITSQQPQLSDGLSPVHLDHDRAAIIQAIQNGQRFHDPDIAREDYLTVDESYRTLSTTHN